MSEFVFLLEELSARRMLEGIIPRIVPSDIAVRYIVFEGKSDLDKNFVRKIRSYTNTAARFFVIRDQDSHPDCKILKSSLIGMCTEIRMENIKIRIMCRELETIYLADLAAVEAGLGQNGLAKKQNSGKFRFPDKLISPSRDLDALTKGSYQKVGGSRAISPHLDLDNQRSSCFSALVSSIRQAVTACGFGSPNAQPADT